MLCSSFLFLLAILHTVGIRSTLIGLYKTVNLGYQGQSSFDHCVEHFENVSDNVIYSFCATHSR